MFVYCECCVLSGRGLCDQLITRRGESCVWSRNLENEEAKARYGAVKNTTKRVVTPRKQANNTVVNYNFLSPRIQTWQRANLLTSIQVKVRNTECGLFAWQSREWRWRSRTSKLNASKGLAVYHGISDVLPGNTVSHPRRQ